MNYDLTHDVNTCSMKALVNKHYIQVHIMYMYLYLQVEDVWRADSQSPLSVAIIYNDLSTVRKLVSAVNVKELCLQKSPLCMAISYGMYIYFKDLLL